MNIEETIAPKKQRRSLPNGEVWNQASWKEARRRAIASKDHTCAICHHFIDVTLPMNGPDGKRNKMSVEVDHIIPTSRNGALYDLDNLQLTHLICNRKKGARMTSDYEGLDTDNPVPWSNQW